jgi:hypothetical protein
MGLWCLAVLIISRLVFECGRECLFDCVVVEVVTEVA